MSESQLQTKVRFLQNELLTCQEELSELKHLLDLNKRMIGTFSREQLSNNVCVIHMLFFIQLPTTDASNRLPDKDTTPPNNTYKTLFDQLTHENSSLYLLNSLLTKQRDEARAQALVYDQIAEIASQREAESNMESLNKVNEMKRQMTEKEEAFQELYKKVQLNRKKLITKQVVSPTLDILQMHAQIDFLENKVIKLIHEKRDLKEDKNGLLVMNKLLQEQAQLTKLSSHPEKQPDEDAVLEEPSLGQFNEGVSDDEDELQRDNDSLQDTELPNKVNHGVSSPKAILPILDMKKAFKVQKLGIQKQERMDEEEEINYKQLKLKQQMDQEIKIQLPQSKAQTPASISANMQMGFTSPNKLYLQLESASVQLKSLTKELGACRMSLQDELFTTKNLEAQTDELNRRLEDCQHSNEILLMSQHKYESKWALMYHSYNEYYYFFTQHRDKENQINVLSHRSDHIHPQILSPRCANSNQKDAVKTLLDFTLGDEVNDNEIEEERNLSLN